MEKLWQFSKIYENIPESTQKKSRFSNQVIWKYQAENHMYVKSGKTFVKKEYLKWRRTGMSNKEPVRYPGGW